MEFDIDNQLSLGLGFERKHNSSVPQSLDMPDADVVIYSRFFDKNEGDRIFQELITGIDWRQDKIKYYGKEIDLPRLTAWHGDVGKSYTYSHIAMDSTAWTPTLLLIKQRIEDVAQVSFNSVLLNLYRSGKDGVSWHSDDEDELGENPVVGSVSFGEARTFQFRHKLRKDLKKIDVLLTHGSLLIMRGATQRFWKHQIPKTTRPTRSRINLTFRRIH